MQTVGPSDSRGDVRSVGPIDGTRRQREPSGTQGRTEASGQEAGKTLLSTSTYSLLIYSIFSTSSSEGHQSGTPSKVKVNRVEQHQPSAHPGLKGSSTIDFLLAVQTPPECPTDTKSADKDLFLAFYCVSASHLQPPGGNRRVQSPDNRREPAEEPMLLPQRRRCQQLQKVAD